MNDLRVGLLLLVAGSLSACGGNEAPPPDFKTPDPSGVAPAAVLDLSHWALTLPVDADGGSSGIAKTVRTDELLAGYASDWFYGSAGDGVTFWAPINGALTPSSRYARSELREMRDPADPAVNWSMSDAALMNARLAVNQMPLANDRVVIGKILGYNGTDSDVSFLAHLIFQYQPSSADAAVYALVEHSPQGAGASADRFNLADGVKLNQPFSYSIQVSGGNLTVTVEGHSATTPIDPQWTDKALYFRAGAGLNARGSDPADGGRVTFYELSVTH
jgi:hypothetical protein